MQMSKRFFFTLILSLSASPVYAEVSVNSISNNSSIKQDVIPADSVNKIAPTNGSWQLTAEQWELARTGEAMLSSTVLKQVVNAWLSEENKVIEIQYPGGEDGELWVQELSNRLVSLGIPSQSMIAVPGSGADDMIQFNLVNE